LVGVNKAKKIKKSVDWEIQEACARDVNATTLTLWKQTPEGQAWGNQHLTDTKITEILEEFRSAAEDQIVLS